MFIHRLIGRGKVQGCKRHLVTGGAGFVGSNLVQRLIGRNEDVLVLDDFSVGNRRFLTDLNLSEHFRCESVDCADGIKVLEAMEAYHTSRPITDVWHLAANSDVAAGAGDPRIDLRKTFLTTFEILDSMMQLGIPQLHFASSSAIYGDVPGYAITENHGPLQPISNYGAMKLASEAQIHAAHSAGLQRANIFRFPNVVGTPATHGVILDLIRKCQKNPHVLDVLGDGSQRKIYLHVTDLIDAMLFIAEHASDNFNVYNIGPEDDGVSVSMIAESVRQFVSPVAKIRFGQGNRGWIGDVPSFRYSVERLSRLGWQASMTSKQAVIRAVDEIFEQLSHD